MKIAALARCFAFLTLVSGYAGRVTMGSSDSLEESIRLGNAQLQQNIQDEQERRRQAKFYWGWHEGYHWDPNNGWHRWNHQGLYDPYDSNITVPQRRE